MTALIGKLARLQDEAAQLAASLGEADCRAAFHADLSPLGWHLGHCVYAESHWVQERLLDGPAPEPGLQSLYLPELSDRQTRGAALPRQPELIRWARVRQAENRAALLEAVAGDSRHELLDGHFLLHFLIQHYSQHIETMYLALTERQLARLDGGRDMAAPLAPETPGHTKKRVKSGAYKIGSPQLPYDNEHPARTVPLAEFYIAEKPVSNAEYRMFMLQGGYEDPSYWSEAGWEWQKSLAFKRPHHWRRQEDGWFGVDHTGAYPLDGRRAVYGLSYHEAAAYANWAGAGLAHEYEWEAAFRQGLLKDVFSKWEWCANTFHAYPGFKPYPYEGYSLPYFDERHYVLRGGTAYTKAWLRRPSFRNYYEAGKRHILAGLRLVYR